MVVFSFVILYPVHILDYPRYFSCTGVQFRKVVNHIFVIAGTGMAMNVPSGGRYLVYQPLLDEGVYRLNGGIPGYSTDFCYGLVAGPALMRLTVLAPFEVTIHCQFTGIQTQQEDLVGQREVGSTSVPDFPPPVCSSPSG